MTDQGYYVIVSRQFYEALTLDPWPELYRSARRRLARLRNG